MLAAAVVSETQRCMLPRSGEAKGHAPSVAGTAEPQATVPLCSCTLRRAVLDSVPLIVLNGTARAVAILCGEPCTALALSGESTETGEPPLSGGNEKLLSNLLVGNGEDGNAPAQCDSGSCIADDTAGTHVETAERATKGAGDRLRARGRATFWETVLAPFVPIKC